MLSCQPGLRLAALEIAIIVPIGWLNNFIPGMDFTA
jgi:hypothetical protein